MGSLGIAAGTVTKVTGHHSLPSRASTFAPTSRFWAKNWAFRPTKSPARVQPDYGRSDPIGTKIAGSLSQQKKIREKFLSTEPGTQSSKSDPRPPDRSPRRDLLDLSSSDLNTLMAKSGTVLQSLDFNIWKLKRKHDFDHQISGRYGSIQVIVSSNKLYQLGLGSSSYLACISKSE